MNGDNEDKNSDTSSWAFSTSTGSANADNKDSSTGVSAFSTDPSKNVGDRALSNWGEEPRINDSTATKTSSIWHSIARLFGAPKS